MKITKIIRDMDECVRLLIEEKQIVAIFQGKGEWGPRALGNRSILASPLFDDMKKHLNLSIKKREGFRPFAPTVLEEDIQDYFVMDGHMPVVGFLKTCQV